MAQKHKRTGGLLLALCALALLLLTACGSSSSKVLKKVQLGQKYLSQSSYTEAVTAFTEAIQLDPDSIVAYMGRAEAYLGLEQYEDAKTDYSTVLDKAARPMQKAEAYAGRADALRYLGDLDGARQDYEAALSLLESTEDSTTKSSLLERVNTALTALGDENGLTETDQSGPKTVSPLPLASVQSPLADGTYYGAFECDKAVSGSKLSFEVEGCYYYDAAQIESLQPGDTLTGQYNYFESDDYPFELSIEAVGELEGTVGRWVTGQMQEIADYAIEPYETDMMLIKEGDYYFLGLDYLNGVPISDQKDYRPIGNATETMANDIVLKVTPYGGSQITVKGIDNVKKVLAANGNDWWMCQDLLITIKNHQITEIVHSEHFVQLDDLEPETTFEMPDLSSNTSAASSAAKLDLADYVGTDLHSFLASRPELKSDGATDGEEYTDGSLTVGASYNGSKIDFVDLRKSCGYTIAGIECGMSADDAAKLAEQRYGAAEEKNGSRASYVIDSNLYTYLQISFANGKVTGVSISSELNLYE